MIVYVVPPPPPTTTTTTTITTQARVHRLMKQVDEAQLKEVYDELGMPYEVKTEDHDAGRTPEEEGVKGASEREIPESSSNSFSDETGAASHSKTD